mmetsp:Transcript_22782/g.36784  ORF Transcript_22782/g.36784 Transcript_22782/m.36784 type:complete len:307 (+) Transcript_22782:264-1184(+)
MATRGFVFHITTDHETVLAFLEELESDFVLRKAASRLYILVLVSGRGHQLRQLDTSGEVFDLATKDLFNSKGRVEVSASTKTFIGAACRLMKDNPGSPAKANQANRSNVFLAELRVNLVEVALDVFNRVALHLLVHLRLAEMVRNEAITAVQIRHNHNAFEVLRKSVTDTSMATGVSAENITNHHNRPLGLGVGLVHRVHLEAIAQLIPGALGLVVFRYLKRRQTARRAAGTLVLLSVVAHLSPPPCCSSPSFPNLQTRVRDLLRPASSLLPNFQASCARNSQTFQSIFATKTNNQTNKQTNKLTN